MSNTKKKSGWPFETAFGPAADFYDTFTLEPPPPKSSETLGWTADCTSLIAQQLPKLKSCAQSGSGIQFQFDGPSKGGTFIFKLSLTAPAGELSHNQWAARVTGADQTEMVAMGEGFELLPSGHPTVPTLPPDSNKPDSNRPRHLNHFEQYWPVLWGGFYLNLGMFVGMHAPCMLSNRARTFLSRMQCHWQRSSCCWFV